MGWKEGVECVLRGGAGDTGRAEGQGPLPCQVKEDRRGRGGGRKECCPAITHPAGWRRVVKVSASRCPGGGERDSDGL